MRLAFPRPIDLSCATWGRASFTLSAGVWPARSRALLLGTGSHDTSAPGPASSLTAPAPSRAIRGVLAKFADLPQEAEEEIRTLDEWRRRIAELERQIKSVTGMNGAQRIDQGTVERAVTAAIERERIEWQRKMEQGRARFQRLGAALASTGQSLVKVKELLEETEREWLVPQTVDNAPAPLPNRPKRTAKLAPDRISMAEELNGTLKLAAGERRILTALAQYSKGRSKVQVAVLTGYAATGGGFNNYLGALRSRGLIEGDGDRLTITEAGTQVLGRGSRCRRVPH
jgi:hypothetical protein